MDTEMEMNFMVEKLESGEHMFTFIRALCPELSDTFLELTDNEKFFNEDVQMTESQLFTLNEQLKMKVEAGNMALFPLVSYLAELFKTKNEQFEKMSTTGKITFDHLTKLFRLGDKFVAVADEGELVGSIVSAANVVPTPHGPIFQVTGTFTFSDGKTFYQENRDFYIPAFGGMKYVDSLNVRPMKPQEEVILTARGKIFAEYALKPHYVGYTGTMFINTMYGCMHFDSTGRIIIDHVGSRKNKPDHNNRFYGDNHNHKATFDTIPEDLLYLTWPFFDAFSSKAKRWGKAYVRNVSQIKFNDTAFDTLVLDEKKKKLFKALAMHAEKGFTDIVDDKSGGCIFLLHGLPGTGKTLTAESLAELLHRPLYSVTVGELGTTVKELETKLANILEMTESWNAILLIDECDIFLEKREDGDLERNAMVGIFLRLLERHKGIMFLTTNRITSLDTAFESRISVVAKYDKLELEARYQIWQNLLEAANITTLEIDDIIKLSQREINGRQIKNSIRMSQALAVDSQETLNIEHFDIVMENLTF